jgi:hypothetical protein
MMWPDLFGAEWMLQLAVIAGALGVFLALVLLMGDGLASAAGLLPDSKQHDQRRDHIGQVDRGTFNEARDHHAGHDDDRGVQHLRHKDGPPFELAAGTASRGR